MCLDAVTRRNGLAKEKIAYKVVKYEIRDTTEPLDLVIPGMHMDWPDGGDSAPGTTVGVNGQVLRSGDRVLIERDDGCGHAGGGMFGDVLDGRVVYWFVDASVKLPNPTKKYYGDITGYEFTKGVNVAKGGMNSLPEYHMGFHAYANKEDAFESRSSDDVVVKVRFTDLICYGLQNMMKVVVANKMEILEQVSP